MKIQRRLESLESKIGKNTTPAIPEDFVEFNQMIGLPKSKIPPFEELPLFPYELQIIANLNAHKNYALVKARGIGATELILRWILHKAILNQVPGRKFLIITGNRLDLAQDHIKRMIVLCQKIPHIITGSVSQDSIQIGKSEIIAMPARPSAIRGYENVDVIFADEAAHWDLVDDSPVLEAIEPHRTKSDAHIIIVSTPNGRRGFFADIFHNDNTRYYRDTMPWTVSEDLLISREEVEKIRKEDWHRFEQEYNCQFMTTRYSAFPQEILDIMQENTEEYQLRD